MKYYIHKETGEPLATLDNSMINVHKANKVSGCDYLGEMENCITLCIFPERWCANGIPFQAISFKELSKFKRVAEKKFFELCSDFGQFRHKDDITFKYHKNIFNIPIRQKTFGE